MPRKCPKLGQPFPVFSVFFEELARCYTNLEIIEDELDCYGSERPPTLLAQYHNCQERIRELESQIADGLRAWRPTDAKI
jgi:hypothetical protein